MGNGKLTPAYNFIIEKNIPWPERTLSRLGGRKSPYNLPLKQLMCGFSFLLPFEVMGGVGNYHKLAWQVHSRNKNGKGRKFCYRTRTLEQHDEIGWRIWRIDNNGFLPIEPYDNRYKFEYGIPISPNNLKLRKNLNGFTYGFPFNQMEIGDSFLVKRELNITAYLICQSINTYVKYNGKKFSTRSRSLVEDKEDGIRVWLISDAE